MLRRSIHCSPQSSDACTSDFSSVTLSRVVSSGVSCVSFFFFQAEDGIRDIGVTEVQTCALPIFEAAGVRVGDTLVAIDDHEFLGDLSSDLAGHKPGETVAFRFTSRGRPIKVKVVLGAANLPAYSLVDVPKASDEQRAQRAVWVIGDDRNDGGRP